MTESDITSTADPLIGQVFEGKFQIISVLGEGGMGRVYKARHMAMEKIVAMKTLMQGAVYDDTTFLRFKQEAVAAASLNHPNIIGIYDFGRSSDGTAYLVMEFLSGKTLVEVATGLSPARFLRIFTQVCDGMQHAHKKGIIHRDLKPSNIMLLDTEDVNDLVKIVDFGLAKLASSEKQQELTKSGLIVGSPLFMSPEQCRGDELDYRSDIYSLGCVMYAVLAGRAPFVGTNSMATLFKHVTDTPPPLSELAPYLKSYPRLEQLIMRTLDKDPLKRPQSMADLGKELAVVMYDRSPVQPAEPIPMNPPAPAATEEDRTRRIALPSDPTRPMAPNNAQSPANQAAFPQIVSAGTNEIGTSTSALADKSSSNAPNDLQAQAASNLLPNVPYNANEGSNAAPSNKTNGGSSINAIRSSMSRTSEQAIGTNNDIDAQPAKRASPVVALAAGTLLGVCAAGGIAWALMSKQPNSSTQAQQALTTGRPVIVTGTQGAAAIEPNAGHKTSTGTTGNGNDKSALSEIPNANQASKQADKNKAAKLAAAAASRKRELEKTKEFEDALRQRKEARHLAALLDSEAQSAIDDGNDTRARTLFKQSLAQQAIGFGPLDPHLLITIARLLHCSVYLDGHAGNRDFPKKELDLALQIYKKDEHNAAEAIGKTRIPTNIWRWLAFGCLEQGRVGSTEDRRAYLLWSEAFYDKALVFWGNKPKDKDYWKMIGSYYIAAVELGSKPDRMRLQKMLQQHARELRDERGRK